ncbi:hypothetical protein Q0F99_06395 [Rathayibacter oskolensis]|uniref:hypothetical protein n=1 Tax=Rathayibacter oskolensis TaxID=1891671 RepID=UPI00265F912C|nr:hypothetical protein [Rathayibacter oskolensis]WKK72564.1 hypothetical protein Q0F99_06395 [Rathayibacter oskolensis]
MSASSSPAGTDLESALEVLVHLLPVDCAAASSLGHPFAVETLAVTTMLAATLDETQIDLGQGPAWDAFGTRRPVVLQCDDSDDRRRWPFVEAALSRHGIATATALPSASAPSTSAPSRSTAASPCGSGPSRPSSPRSSRSWSPTASSPG